MKILFLFLIICVFVAGCYTSSVSDKLNYKLAVSDEARDELQKPIDCSTAQQDIQILEREKASTTQQLLAGVKMIIPVAAARGILHRDYLDRGTVACGEYNREIDAKINEIKSACGLE